MNPKPPYLTKSRFVNGVNCNKWLWKSWHEPLPYVEPDPGSFEAKGTDIGVFAQSLFPGGVLVDEPAWQHKKAVARTQALIADPSVPSIFEAAVEFANIRIRADILERKQDGTWRLCEVKSGTGVKEKYELDLAIQYFVLTGSGIPVTDCRLVHINNKYVYDGKAHDWNRFFTQADCLPRVQELQEGLQKQAEALFEILRAESCPQTEPGRHCPDYCGYLDECTENKPGLNWIQHLPRLSEKQEMELHDLGIEDIRDIPSNFPLNASQEQVRISLIEKRDYISPDLSRTLEEFAPPCCYLDFETMNPGVPVFAFTRPYQRQPFQWSLHIDEGEGDLDHKEFLGHAGTDPRRSFCDSLIAALEGIDGPILVYSSFEHSVLKDMATLFPDLSEPVDNIINRLRDLLPVVRNHTYFREYGGSFSIKSVGPAIAPNVDYKALEGISDGGAASSAFELMANGSLADPEGLKSCREALLAYCNLDTLAMVEVHRKLIALSKRN